MKSLLVGSLFIITFVYLYSQIPLPKRKPNIYLSKINKYLNI